MNISTIQKLKTNQVEVFGEQSFQKIFTNYNKHFKKIEELKSNMLDEALLKQEYQKFKSLVSKEWSKLTVEKIYNKINISSNFVHLNKLIKIYRTLPLSSVECEHVFSNVSIIKNELRNSLDDTTLDDLLMINKNGEDLKNYDFKKAFKTWQSEKTRNFI